MIMNMQTLHPLLRVVSSILSISYFDVIMCTKNKYERLWSGIYIGTMIHI